MAFQVDPPKTNGHIDIQQAWHRLINMLNSQFIETGWDGILFVDATDGHDASAKRGSLTFKYQTIQAALDDAQAGDVVWVGPGTYAEDIVWPDVNDVTLRGFGIDQTTITNATASTTVSVAPTVDTVTNFSIFDLEIANDGANHCLDIYGTNDLNLGGVDTPIWIQNVRFSAAGLGLSLALAAHVRMNNVYSQRATIYCEQYGLVTVSNSFIQDVQLISNAGGQDPSAGFGAFILDSTQAGDVTVNEEAVFVATDDTQIVNLTGNLTDEAEGVFGSIMDNGRIVGNVAVTFVLSVAANVLSTVAIFDGARISGTFAFGGGGASEQATCRARHANFYDGAAGSIVVDTYGVLDIRESYFTQASLSSPDTLGDIAGQVDRTHWIEDLSATGAMQSVIFGVGGGAVNAVPYPTDDYMLTFESDTVANLPVQVNNKNSAQVQVTDSGAGAGDLRLLVHRRGDN